MTLTNDCEITSRMLKKLFEKINSTIMREHLGRQ